MDPEFLKKVYEHHREMEKVPTSQEVGNFFYDLLGTLFPEFARQSFASQKEFEWHVEDLCRSLHRMLSLPPNHDPEKGADRAATFFELLPQIHAALELDIEAMEAGDPAAKSRSEVIRSYPGFVAIAAYRFAHELHKMGILVIPRVLAEFAHKETGIDIHPGARIGSHFCIDHGTGIVVGETTVIGSYVKLYQGVTLGALSVNKADASTKRHPTIENHSVIYAGATILGGETVVGHDSIIGGNVWLTRSVPPYSKIYYRSEEENG